MITDATETQVLTATIWIFVFVSGACSLAAVISVFKTVLSSNDHHPSEGCDDEGETQHMWNKWAVIKYGWFNNTQRRVCQRCGEHEQRTVRK